MGTAIPVVFRRKEGGGNPEIARLPEAATQTFRTGVPVLVTSGFATGPAVVNSTNPLVGFSTEHGKNRATAGLPQTLTFGDVPNQANARNIPLGAPMDDGRVGVILAKPGTRFMCRLNTAIAATHLGASFGMVRDTNNFWHISPALTLPADIVVRITDLVDPIGTVNGLVEFEVLTSRIQNF